MLGIRLSTLMGLGVLAAVYVPTKAFEAATGVLSGFAGVVVAALVPTMILSATILSPAALGKNEFKQVRLLVETQISFFSGLFLFAILLAILIFVGSLMGWEEHSFSVTLPTVDHPTSMSIDVTRIITGMIVSISALVAIQLIGFIAVIRSLFEIHAVNAERELDRRIRDENAQSLEKLKPSEPRINFGENIGKLG